MGQVTSNLPPREPEGTYTERIEDDFCCEDNGKTAQKLSFKKRAARSTSLVCSTLVETENFKDVKRGIDRTNFLAISKYEAGMQLFKVLVGTGILFMPQAFQSVGVGLGLTLLFLLGAITIRTYEFVIEASQHFAKKNQATSYSYSDTFRLALEKWPLLSPYGSFGQHLVSWLIIIASYSVGMVYVLLIALNVQSAILNEMGKQVSLQLIIACEFPLLVLFTSFPKLKHLTPITIFALIALWTGIGLTVFQIVSHLIIFKANIEAEKWDFSQIPTFLGIALFAFNGIPCITAIENNMNNPKKFIGWPSVVSIVVPAVTAIYIGYGLLGYFTFGPGTKGPITDSFVPNETLSVFLKISIALGLFFSCPMILFPPFKILSEYAFDKAPLGKKKIMSILMRLSQLLIIVLVPMLITDMLALLNLLSGLNLILQFIIPVLIDILTFTLERHGNEKLIASVRNIILLVIGIFVVGLTFYSGVHDVLKLYNVL